MRITENDLNEAKDYLSQNRYHKHVNDTAINKLISQLEFNYHVKYDYPDNYEGKATFLEFVKAFVSTP